MELGTGESFESVGHPMATSSSKSRTSSSSNGGNGSKAVEARALRARLTWQRIAALDVYACAHCHREDGLLLLCGNCRGVAYCDGQCQRLDWTQHKKTCKQRNPTHFVGDRRTQIDWFVRLLDRAAESVDIHHCLLACLVAAFCLRCKDENTETDYKDCTEQDMRDKLTRFVYAAKGARLLPIPFRDSHLAAALDEALHRLRPSNGYGPNRVHAFHGSNGVDGSSGSSGVDGCTGDGNGSCAVVVTGPECANASDTDALVTSLKLRFPALQVNIDDLRKLHFAICGPVFHRNLFNMI